MITKAQWNRWWSDFSQRYPTVRDYAARQDSPEKLLDGWYQSMAAFDAETLGQVTKMMLAGDLEEIPNTELGHFGAEIRARARRVNEIRRDAEPQDWEYEVGAEPEHERRYECARCLDTGYVTVVGPASLKHAWIYREDTDDPRFTIQPTALACDCRRGGAIYDSHRKYAKRPISRWSSDISQHPIFTITDLLKQAVASTEATDFLTAQRICLSRMLREYHRKCIPKPTGELF